MERVEDHWPNAEPPVTANGNGETATVDHIAIKPKKNRWFLKTLIAMGVVIAIFGGLIYGAVYYVTSRPLYQQITSIFADAKTGRANTDINLRPDPSSNNDPIGVVTKNSRLRIVKTQNKLVSS
jgi:hypothetical protein